MAITTLDLVFCILEPAGGIMYNPPAAAAGGPGPGGTVPRGHAETRRLRFIIMPVSCHWAAEPRTRKFECSRAATRAVTVTRADPLAARSAVGRSHVQ